MPGGGVPVTDIPDIVLVHSGASWFVGRDGTYPALLDPCEFHGAIQTRQSGPGAADVRIVRVVQPVEGLLSLRSLMAPGPRVEMVDLSVEERQDITRKYGACVSMMQTLRAQANGLITPVMGPGSPLLVLPGGRS